MQTPSDPNVGGTETPASFLIRHKTFAVTIVMILLTVLSIAAWVKIPIEVMPKENTPPFLFLRANAKESMSPDRQELALTMPLEGAVRTLPGLIKFNSSTNSRSTSLSLTYRPHTNLDLASFQLQEALQDLESKGILDMRQISISRLNPEASAVLKLSVTQEGAMQSPVGLLKEDLRLGLEAIPEISKVEIIGTDSPVYQYSIPISRAEEAGFSGADLSSILSFQSFQDSLGSAPLTNSESLTAIKARLLLKDLDQIRSQSLGKGSTISISQISMEKVIDKSKEEISRKNGEMAIFLEIYAKDSANLFALTNHLKAYLARIKNDNSPLSKLGFDFVFNKTDDLKSAISDVFEALYQSVLITFAIVYLFLRRWRQTALIAISIPSTLLLTIFILYLKGVSLNILTLSGLILGIGMVVDNAVLIVGRIDELRAAGLRHQDAAARASSDVTKALLMSMATNAFIFLPVAFIEGGDSFTDILKAFQVPILASLASSLVVALILLPLITMFWKSKSVDSGASQSEMETSEKIVRGFRWIQGRRKPIAIGTAVLLFLVTKSISGIQQTDIESPRDPYSSINVRFAPETDPLKRREIFEDIEKKILALQPEFRFAVSDFNPEYANGSILVYPHDTANKDEELQRLDERLKKFADEIPLRPGVAVSLGFEAGPIGKTRRQEVLKITGPRTAQITDLLASLGEKFKQVKGVETVHLEKDESDNISLIFLPQEEVIVHYGLDLPKISQAISASMGSASVSNLNLNGQVVGARINLVPASGEWNLASLRALRIKVGEHSFVNFADLGRLIPFNFPGNISRTSGIATGKIFVYFQESLSESDFRSARDRVQSLFRRETFPNGYGVPKNDADQRVQEMQEKGNFIIGLSLVLIYLLLGGMLESFFMPFALLFTIPLAILFGIVGLVLFGMDLDVMARLSLVILVGSGVNGAIILIDLINTLRAQGYRREDAVVLGCARRFKAVLMSMSIQVIGVLPVALGKAKIMGIPYSSLGIVIISGMLFSTLVTLVILPMVYEVVDDFEQKVKINIGLR